MAADTRTAAFLAVGLAAFVAWQAAALAGLGRRVAVALGLLGFVLHVVFAKGYTLVPSYFARRLILAIPVVLFGTTLTFMIIYLGPIDPVSAILGPQSNTQAYEQIEAQLGLNKPLFGQYIDFLILCAYLPAHMKSFTETRFLGNPGDGIGWKGFLYFSY